MRIFIIDNIALNVDNDTDALALIEHGARELTAEEIEAAGMTGYEHLVCLHNTEVKADGSIVFTPPEPYEPTPEEIAEAELAAAKTEAESIVTAKMRMSFAQTATFTASEFSLLAKAEYFPVWTAGETYAECSRISHEGVVYEVVAPGGVTAQEHQPPSAEGMLAVYRPLSADPETGEEPSGTQDDPIPFVYGMDVKEGSYYSYNGKLYLANLTMPACVWTPDTPGLWQWTEVTETA